MMQYCVTFLTHLEFWIIIHKNCDYTNIWDIPVHNKLGLQFSQDRRILHYNVL